MMRFRKMISLAIVATLALTVLASAGNVQAQSTPASNISGNLEIYSWWAGDEAPALDALVKLYQQKYPNVKVNNATVTGGSGVAARAVLKTRMLGGAPPDSFQVHAGQELIGTWVVANRMEPLTQFYKDQSLNDKFPKALIDLMTYKGDIWSVPVDIHRSNVFWYIPATLKKLNLTVPKTWDEFLKDCPVIKAAGMTPLALGENWTAAQLWENVLLSVVGPDSYRKLWAGQMDWTDQKVKDTWTLFGKILDCANTDSASLTWQQASDLVITNKAVFNLMGDWAAGYYTTTKKLAPGTDFGWAAAPGTDGVFVMLSDAFGLPKNIKDKDATMAWLTLLGSKEGQDVFNPLKGSIAARVDTDMTKYNTYSQSAAADFQKDQIVGSLWHGAVAPESFTNDFATVISVFLGGGHDVDLAVAATAQLAAQDIIKQ